ncbi:MAG: hypothetical protein LQ338_004681 [Usnochroma carphineum]|nr:MAG: hypothetical protein LQ338_004681 [Usnochroma carphineum]
MEHDATHPEDVIGGVPRPFKRRKYYRKRTGSPDDEVRSAEISAITNSVPSPGTVADKPAQTSKPSRVEEEMAGDSPLTVAEVLRRRKAVQRRRGGIEFTNAAPVAEDSVDDARLGDEVLDNEDSFAKILNVVDRFAPQTGQVADVDKHMVAYIDSVLAKRRQDQDRPIHTSNGQYSDDDMLDDIPADLAKHRQPAALGKLHEIDLGPDATLRNIARTEAAKRRLEGGEPEVEESTGKVRLRKDGKPWRGRRRRNSNDVKRDKLVEEVMKESRLEIYDEPEMELPNDDQAADDRIAEQFRREFMDAISSRRQRTANATKKDPRAKVDDKPKGPKLGGSRSARAAMREQQEKATKK